MARGTPPSHPLETFAQRKKARRQTQTRPKCVVARRTRTKRRHSTKNSKKQEDGLQGKAVVRDMPAISICLGLAFSACRSAMRRQKADLEKLVARPSGTWLPSRGAHPTSSHFYPFLSSLRGVWRFMSRLASTASASAASRRWESSLGDERRKKSRLRDESLEYSQTRCMCARTLASVRAFRLFQAFRGDSKFDFKT